MAIFRPNRPLGISEYRPVQGGIFGASLYPVTPAGLPELSLRSIYDAVARRKDPLLLSLGEQGIDDLEIEFKTFRRTCKQPEINAVLTAITNFYSFSKALGAFSMADQGDPSRFAQSKTFAGTMTSVFPDTAATVAGDFKILNSSANTTARISKRYLWMVLYTPKNLISFRTWKPDWSFEN